MIKRFLITAILGCILVVAGVGYGLFRLKRHTPQPVNTKAPERQITIIEGLDIKEIAGYLEKQGVEPASSFITYVNNYDSQKSDYEFLASIPQGHNLEGFLFPDTYQIFKRPYPTSTTASNIINAEIIRKMLDNFDIKFTAEMRAKAQTSGLSVYELITLASIIEKETGRTVSTTAQKQSLDEERKIIAGIFYNRLNAGVALESDATVNYVTGKNDPGATAADTEINSPYNTYKFKGLPPGPICNPSLSSILATLYPTDTEYFYFLHDQKTGQAFYAKTYDQHLINKQKYLR